MCMNPYCKSPFSNLEAHHIIHRSLGGPNDLNNLITLCHTCHDKIENGQLDIYYDILIYWKNYEFFRWHESQEQILKRAKYNGL